MIEYFICSWLARGQYASDKMLRSSQLLSADQVGILLSLKEEIRRDLRAANQKPSSIDSADDFSGKA